jgi:hypothetical protein
VRARVQGHIVRMLEETVHWERRGDDNVLQRTKSLLEPRLQRHFAGALQISTMWVTFTVCRRGTAVCAHHLLPAVLVVLVS